MNQINILHDINMYVIKLSNAIYHVHIHNIIPHFGDNLVFFQINYILFSCPHLIILFEILA